MGWMNTMNTALFGCLCSPSKEDSTAAPEQGRSANSGEAATIAADVPEMTMRQLNQATAKFSASRLIGRGAYAEVFRATLRGGRAAAAKRLIRRRPPPGATAVVDAAGTLRQQVAVASWLRHENVVRLLGYNITADLPVLLYELAGAGTLHDALHGPSGTPDEAEETAVARQPPPAAAMRLSWEQRARIALDAAAGLAYLHEAAVTHGDVRSPNVLLFEGLGAKIADHNVFKELFLR